jgi:hypothetical protein
MKSIRALIDTRAIDSLSQGHREYELQPISTADMLSGDLKKAIEEYDPEKHENSEFTQALIVLLTKLGCFADSEHSPFLAALVPVRQKKEKKNETTETNNSSFWAEIARDHTILSE